MEPESRIGIHMPHGVNVIGKVDMLKKLYQQIAHSDGRRMLLTNSLILNQER